MSIIWDESLIIGNKEIDDDHKKLIDMVGLVEQALESDVEPDELTRILHDLDNFTVEHFRREERIMQQINYPGFQQHFKEHKDLIARFTALKNDIIINLKKRQHFEESEALIDMLRHWLIDHVINEDRLIKPYLK